MIESRLFGLTFKEHSAGKDFCASANVDGKCPGVLRYGCATDYPMHPSIWGVPTSTSL